METIAPENECIKLSRRTVRTLIHDAARSAEAVNLIYMTDEGPGITRVKGDEGFGYFLKGEPVTDEEQLGRIKSLVIPPAWEQVWICPDPRGHLQVTGFDARGRKQYKYHSQWTALRNQTKFFRLYDFGKALPLIRDRLKKDLMTSGLTRTKVLAAIVSIMEETNIRVGSCLYEKLYGSFGLSTLKDRHVKVQGSKIRFLFKGKKGVIHDISIRNRKLSKIVHQCREIPGKDLFQYYDADGKAQLIDSGAVNEYIREISGSDFTSKDFRTWAGSVECIRAFKEIGFEPQKTAARKNIVAALDRVAHNLGNTRAVCKKYYVHPRVLSFYEENRLEKYIKKVDKEDGWLNTEEVVLMKILAAH